MNARDMSLLPSTAFPHEGGHGMHWIHGYQCQYPPAIGVSDLLLVDFSQRRIDRDGLYLVETSDGWRGCRRFHIRFGATRIDRSGNGEWSDFYQAVSEFNVVGHVEKVFREVQAS
jgi:hypothetical protein